MLYNEVVYLKDKFRKLLFEFHELAQKKGGEFIINIIQKYCDRHNLSGPDGLAGLLDYIKVKYGNKQVSSSDGEQFYEMKLNYKYM